jgi:hypothetical protein
MPKGNLSTKTEAVMIRGQLGSGSGLSSIWGMLRPPKRRCAARSRLASARHEPSNDFLVRIAPTAMELVLLDGLFSEPDNLFFSLSLILWKGHPLANDFAARLVVFFHVRGSLAYFFGRRPCARFS